MPSCRSCGAADLTVFLSQGDLPASDGFLRRDQLDRPEKRYPLDVAVCGRCNLVQILETVPPEELFSADYVYLSSFSDSLLEHSRRHVEARIAEQRLDDRSLVVELASNDGYLLQYYHARGIPVLGIDPAPAPVEAARERGIPTLLAFFGKDVATKLRGEGKRADLIHANNVLAHVADTNGFLEGVRVLLKDDGLAVFEFPYLLDLIDHCEFDTIYHEHLCYFSVTALVPLFRRHGLHLNDVEHLPIHGGSLRVFVQPRELEGESVRRALEVERSRGFTGPEPYREFARRVRGIREDLRALLDEIRGRGERVAGYGAAAKGTILLNTVGIGPETLEFVADRNVHKHGRWIPGVRVPIVPVENILETMPDYLLILPWNLKQEIMEQQSEYRARGGRFIVPIPSPGIV